MINFLLAASVIATPVDLQESIDRMCAYRVGIPYASDNFTEEEWQKFKLCRDIMNDTFYHKVI